MEKQQEQQLSGRVYTNLPNSIRYVKWPIALESLTLKFLWITINVRLIIYYFDFIICHWSITSFTRPTIPFSRRTLIPKGWDEDLVRISFTIPSVNFPVFWLPFWTTFTLEPRFMLPLVSPSNAGNYIMFGIIKTTLKILRIFQLQSD